MMMTRTMTITMIEDEKNAKAWRQGQRHGPWEGVEGNFLERGTALRCNHPEPGGKTLVNVEALLRGDAGDPRAAYTIAAVGLVGLIIVGAVYVRERIDATAQVTAEDASGRSVPSTATEVS